MCYEKGRASMKIIMKFFWELFLEIIMELMIYLKKEINKILIVTRREKKFEKINIGKYEFLSLSKNNYFINLWNINWT